MLISITVALLLAGAIPAGSSGGAPENHQDTEQAATLWIAGQAPRFTVVLVVGDDSKQAKQLESVARQGLQGFEGSNLEIHTAEGAVRRIRELRQGKGGVRGPIRAFPGVNCPDLVPQAVVGDNNNPFAKSFQKYIDVFGIKVYATKSVAPEKLVHAAGVLAQWLDDNGDGLPDAPEVVHALAVRHAFIGMTRTERERERRDPF